MKNVIKLFHGRKNYSDFPPGSHYFFEPANVSVCRTVHMDHSLAGLHLFLFELVFEEKTKNKIDAELATKTLHEAKN